MLIPGGRHRGELRQGHIGVVQCVELRPQDVALEAHGVDGRRTALCGVFACCLT